MISANKEAVVQKNDLVQNDLPWLRWQRKLEIYRSVKDLDVRLIDTFWSPLEITTIFRMSNELSKAAEEELPFKHTAESSSNSYLLNSSTSMYTFFPSAVFCMFLRTRYSLYITQ